MKHKSDIQIGKRAHAELMERYGYRAAVVAAAVGCKPNQVYSWAQGACPSTFFLQAMAQLGLDVHYILTGHRSKP